MCQNRAGNKPSLALRGKAGVNSSPYGSRNVLDEDKPASVTSWCCVSDFSEVNTCRKFERNEEAIVHEKNLVQHINYVLDQKSNKHHTLSVN